jgi:two-component system, chemotaxis family, sensor kinase CheA
MSDEEDVGAIFAEECEDLLAVAESSLLALDESLDDQESINGLFRAFHTIKGSAGLFGYNDIVEFTHVAESLLVKVREGEMALTENLVSLLLEGKDQLEKLVDCVLNQTEMTQDLRTRGEHITNSLNGQMGQENVVAEKVVEIDHVAVNRAWHINLKFSEDSFKNGVDPSSPLGYLEKLGTIIQLDVVQDKVPAWEDFDPENCYLEIDIQLVSEASKAAIEEVFEFILDDCQLSISHDGDDVGDIGVDDEARIGDILVASKVMTTAERDDVLAEQNKSFGEVAVDKNIVSQKDVDVAASKQAKKKSGKNQGDQSVRVNAQKLENLINLVGELVISSANVTLRAHQVEDNALSESVEELKLLVEDVRDTTLGLRMVQIGETFNRYKRVVREMSKDLNKQINLHITGGETELDKILVEKVSDPLMHLIRNAADHGIEATETRLKNGKDSAGNIYLEAFHDSGSVVIQIRDDGAGLGKQRIKSKAIEKEIIRQGDKLSDQEIYRLIFAPGFSTAEKVTNISGRGVGMDVVKKNIDSLRGQVDVHSTEGKGSTFSIRLPLTLAIIDGFQVRVKSAFYIIPLDMVDECIELTEELRCEEGDNYINLRGHVLPYVRMSEVFHDNTVPSDSNNRENIVIVQYAGQRIGMLVDELLGEHQTVIKPLGKIFHNLQGISGATILGSGEVAMIIDVPALMRMIIDGSKHQSKRQYSTTEVSS